MKKYIVMSMCCLIVAGCFTGCGEEKNIQECFFCEEEKECETKTVFGEQVYICNDCLEEFSME